MSLLQKTFEEILQVPGARDAWEKISVCLSESEREEVQSLLVLAANRELFSGKRKINSRKLARLKSVVTSLIEIVPPECNPSIPLDNLDGSKVNPFFALPEAMRNYRESSGWGRLPTYKNERIGQLLEEAEGLVTATNLQFPTLLPDGNRLHYFPREGFEPKLRGVLRAYGAALERIDTSKIKREIGSREDLAIGAYIVDILKRTGCRGHYQAATDLVNAALGTQLDTDSLIKAVNAKHGKPAS